MSNTQCSPPELPVTLVDVLRRRSLRQADEAAFTFLLDGDTAQETITYGELDRRARGLAAHLQAMRLEGERVLLLYPPGLEYVVAFFGCLYAAAVAVPAYPPRRNRSLDRLRAIVRDAGAAAVLSTRAIFSTVERMGAQGSGLQSLHWIFAGQVAQGQEDAWTHPSLTGESVAFLQYTSGSTGDPRGVVLAHANLIHNSEWIKKMFGHEAACRGVMWTPPYHDMGLIGGILQPVYAGMPCCLMSPVTCFTNPYAWLRAISNRRGTTSGGPNFAYDLCVRKITPAQRATLDLSCWGLAFTGAEPVAADTLDRFAEAFAPCGFRREAFYPCYGLAEATLIASGGDRLSPPRTLAVRKEDVESHRARPAVAGPGARTLVSCGCGLGDQGIRVVHPERLTECAPNTVGEVWIFGPSVAKGYWNRSEETKETFAARLAGGDGTPFLRTGDLGFLHAGELYITGRLKDLIILQGRNLYPQDLERTAERSHPALESGWGAAFTVPVGGEEKLVLVHEAAGRRPPDLAEAAHALMAAVAEEHEVEVHAVALVKGGTAPRTSSGKVRRRACRDAYLAGELELLGEWRGSAGATSRPGGLTREALMAVEPSLRQALLESYLRDRLAGALRVAPPRIDARQSLASLGLDSLTAMRLKNDVEAALGVALPLTSLLRGDAIAEVACQILAQTAAPPPPDHAQFSRLVQRVEGLSEEDVTALLGRRQAAV